MYREIKTVYKCENYMDCNIRHDLRMCYTQFRLSSHKFLVERTRWRKEQIPYHERTCSLCNIHDVQDEYHIVSEPNPLRPLRDLQYGLGEMVFGGCRHLQYMNIWCFNEPK